MYETGITYEEQGQLVPIARPEDGVLEDRYFTYVFQARYDERGRVDGPLVCVFEATAQVRAEALQAEVPASAQGLAQERAMFSQVFRPGPGRHLHPARAGAPLRILQRSEYYNAAYQQFFPGRELLGRPVAEALPGTVAWGFVALLDEVYRTGTTYFGHESPLTLEGPDGSPPREMHFTFTYQAYRENGQIVGISTFAYDVTGQVLARRALATQQKLQAVFEQAPVAMGVFAGPGRSTWWTCAIRACKPFGGARRRRPRTGSCSRYCPRSATRASRSCWTGCGGRAHPAWPAKCPRGCSTRASWPRCTSTSCTTRCATRRATSRPWLPT